MVGQNLGARKLKRARASGFETLRWALVFSSLVGLLIFILQPGMVVRGFTADPEVIPFASQMPMFMGFAQPALALSMVLGGGFRGVREHPLVHVHYRPGHAGLSPSVQFNSSRWSEPSRGAAVHRLSQSPAK